MTAKHICLTLFVFCIASSFSQKTATPPPVESYGDAKVSTVLRLDEHVRLYCDISELPPVIGQNIPVCINGLKPAADVKDNLKLLSFVLAGSFSLRFSYLFRDPGTDTTRHYKVSGAKVEAIISL